MEFSPDSWQKANFGGISIYFKKDRPGWFVPNRSGDRLLERFAAGRAVDLTTEEETFIAALPRFENADTEQSHPAQITQPLSELWLHLTDRCNLECSHCLFSSSPENRAQISFKVLTDITRQAAELGCKRYILTGGEPLMHPDFERIVEMLLNERSAEVIVQTNGTLLRQSAGAIQGWAARPFRLQVSADGLQDNHDRIRGSGAFARLTDDLERLTLHGVPFSLLMSVDNNNAAQMSDFVDLALMTGSSRVDYMWYVMRGRGTDAEFCSPESLFGNLIAAAHRAEGRGIVVGNVENLRRRVFLGDGGGYPAGIGSAALGPDGALYPSPSLVWLQEMAATVRGNLKKTWNENEIFVDLRRGMGDLFSPMKYYHHGGDIAHSYLSSGSLFGNDPYLPLYESTILWLIAGEAGPISDEGSPALRLKMGGRKLRG